MLPTCTRGVFSFTKAGSSRVPSRGPPDAADSLLLTVKPTEHKLDAFVSLCLQQTRNNLRFGLIWTSGNFSGPANANRRLPPSKQIPS
jgi:hypothetical protein